MAWSRRNCHTAGAGIECANSGWKLQNLPHTRSWKLYCRTFDKDAHDCADVYHSQSDSSVFENANLLRVLVWIQSIHAEADVLQDLFWLKQIHDDPDDDPIMTLCDSKRFAMLPMGVMVWFAMLLMGVMVSCGSKSFMILMFIMASCDSKSFMTMLTCMMALCDSHLHSAWRPMWKAGSSDFPPCFVEGNWNL